MASMDTNMFMHPEDTLEVQVYNAPTKDHPEEDNYYVKFIAKKDGIRCGQEFIIYLNGYSQLADMVHDLRKGLQKLHEEK
jgi:hypothetical protein